MITLDAINEFFKSEKSRFQIVETNIKGEVKTYHYCVKHDNGKLGNLYETLDDVFKDLAIFIYIKNRNNDLLYTMSGNYDEKDIQEAENYILGFQNNAQ